MSFSHLSASQAENYARFYRMRGMPLPLDLEMHLLSLGVEPDFIEDKPVIKVPAIRRRHAEGFPMRGRHSEGFQKLLGIVRNPPKKLIED